MIGEQMRAWRIEKSFGRKSPKSENHLRQVSSFRGNPYSREVGRLTEVAVNRLRVNAHPTRVKSVVEGKDRKCPGCGGVDDAYHWLFDCPAVEGEVREQVREHCGDRWGSLRVLQSDVVGIAPLVREVWTLQERFAPEWCHGLQLGW